MSPTGTGDANFPSQFLEGAEEVINPSGSGVNSFQNNLSLKSFFNRTLSVI